MHRAVFSDFCAVFNVLCAFLTVLCAVDSALYCVTGRVQTADHIAFSIQAILVLVETLTMQYFQNVNLNKISDFFSLPIEIALQFKLKYKSYHRNCLRFKKKNIPG